MRAPARVARGRVARPKGQAPSRVRAQAVSATQARRTRGAVGEWGAARRVARGQRAWPHLRAEEEVRRAAAAQAAAGARDVAASASAPRGADGREISSDASGGAAVSRPCGAQSRSSRLTAKTTSHHHPSWRCSSRQSARSSTPAMSHRPRCHRSTSCTRTHAPLGSARVLSGAGSPRPVRPVRARAIQPACSRSRACRAAGCLPVQATVARVDWAHLIHLGASPLLSRCLLYTSPSPRD